MTQITIDVPEGLESRFIAEVKQLLVKIQARAKHDDALRLVATDDKAMLEYLDKLCMGAKNKDFPPVVRASTYRNSVRRSQEIGGMWSLGAARPVLMRGSIEAMMGKYTTKSGITEEIAERFLRRIKFTALTREPCMEMDQWLRSRLTQNGWYVHRPLFDFRIPGLHHGEEAMVWRGGEWVAMPAEEYELALRSAKNRETDRVRREIKERRAKKQYQDWVASKTELYDARRRAAEEQQQERDTARRKRRATEIAAYELLSEIGAIQ